MSAAAQRRRRENRADAEDVEGLRRAASAQIVRFHGGEKPVPVEEPDQAVALRSLARIGEPPLESDETFLRESSAPDRLDTAKIGVPLGVGQLAQLVPHWKLSTKPAEPLIARGGRVPWAP